MDESIITVLSVITIVLTLFAAALGLGKKYHDEDLAKSNKDELSKC